MEIYCVKEVEQNPVPKSQTKPFYIGTKEAPSDLAQIINCGFMLEPPQRGGSNKYPQSMFWRKIGIFL